MAAKQTAAFVAAAQPGRQNKRSVRLTTRKTLVGLSFIAPNFIGFFVLILIPVFFTFFLSVNKWDGFNPMSFVGSNNFKFIFGDKNFRQAVVKTVTYAVFTVSITTLISLGLAVLINQKLKCIGIFRTALFFPYVASIVAVAAVWQMLFQKDMGLINEVLKLFGVVDVPGWFASTKWALHAVIIVTIWKNMGYYMIIYLAALQDIPTSLIEAGMIDGASAWQRFWRIKFPLLRNATFFVVMMLTINSFKSFDIIFVLTEGGPGTATTLLSQYIYNQSFISWDYGRASAAALILFAIVAAITAVQFLLEKKLSTD
jgi:multiple sugar transport system permease protein